jgi:hypothetical protein
MSRTYWEDLAAKALQDLGTKAATVGRVAAEFELAKWFEHAYEQGKLSGLRRARDLVREIASATSDVERQIRELEKRHEKYQEPPQ